MDLCKYRGCGKEFKKTVPWHKYCSTECKMAEWAIQKAAKNNREALKEANKAMQNK